MPILIDYSPGDGGSLLELASQAGIATGTAERRSQQRAIDAGVQRQAIAAAQERNNRPGFYQRVSEGAAAEGRYAQARQDDIDAQERAIAAQERSQREAIAAQERATAQAAAAESGGREQHARLIEQFNRQGQTPEAASRYFAEATRAGIQPDARIRARAGPTTPAEEASGTRATLATQQAQTRQSEADRRQAEIERANRAREDIQRERIRSQPARGISQADFNRQQADEQAGYGYDPADTVSAMLPDPASGAPSPAAFSAFRGIVGPTRTPGEIEARIAELEEAGLPPPLARQLRVKHAERAMMFREIDDAIAVLPETEDIDQALRQHGISRDQYSRYLREELQRSGLAP